MEATAIMTIALANEGGKPPDYPNVIGFIDENNAGNAIAALTANLVSKTKVLRDRKWSEKEAVILVPEDLINIKLGDIVPADGRLLEGDPLKINQATLTGVSLPFTKNPDDETFAGPTCKQGKFEVVVMATGIYTLCGKAAHLVDSTWSLWPLLWLQKVLTTIGNFYIYSIIERMLVGIIGMYPTQHRAYQDGIDNLLVLLIGGIPIAMPTVLSVTMTIEFHCLTEQGAITKRMTAIKQMAGMDVLCGNKTETLTPNKLNVDKSLIEVYPKNVDQDALVFLVTSASRVENQDPINASVVKMLGDPKEAKARIKGEVILLELCQTQSQAHHEQGVLELVMEEKQQPARSGTGVVVAIKKLNQESLQELPSPSTLTVFDFRLPVVGRVSASFPHRMIGLLQALKGHPYFATKLSQM
ncbi:hypothetical protein Nepgr_011477 [Nepenthes gracilis]|uniref:P-type ATPase A domain-containing protein n=1 Tax=Nepenthes gracilis TaxID=150966 RepID=A0AAD3SF82_NEPGR|nr:hypothetical protein Nepgr_011477 [Nepenthes gracilis]